MKWNLKGLPTKLRLAHDKHPSLWGSTLKLCFADPLCWGSRLPNEGALQQADTAALVMLTLFKRVGHIVAFGMIQLAVKIGTRCNCLRLKNWNNLSILQVSVTLTVRLNICIMSSFLRHLQDILGLTMNSGNTTLMLLWSKNKKIKIGVEERNQLSN